MALEIRTDRSGEFPALVFKAAPSGPIGETRIELDGGRASALADERRKMAEKLRRFHELICATRPAREGFWEAIDEAIGHLNAIGGAYLATLLNKESKGRFYAVMAEAFGLQRVRTAPAQVSAVIGKSDRDLLNFPIEILPIIPRHDEKSQPAAIFSQAELERELLRYPAFGAVVTRIRDGHKSKAELKRGPAGLIPAKIFRNSSFYDSATEAESDAVWLQRHHLIAPEPLWPSETLEPRAATIDLAWYLTDPRVRMRPAATGNGTAIECGDQIQHFSCHFKRTKEGEILELREMKGEVGPLVIEKDALMAQLQEASAPLPDDLPGQLIFLNACGTGASDPTGSLSLVEVLLEWTPARAIVATETPVDFTLAATFARLVYDRLLAGVPLGEAIHGARWALVDERQNPFGLFYSLYGNPNLKSISTP
jgi:hypothetical protein